MDEHADHGRKLVPVLLQLRCLRGAGHRDLPLGAQNSNNNFDAAGRVTQVQGALGGNSTNYASNIGYDPSGPISTLPLNNGVTETWTFNTQRQPTAMAAAKSGTNLLSLNWVYGSPTTDNGNVTSATIAPNGSQSFSQTFTYL